MKLLLGDFEKKALDKIIDYLINHEEASFSEFIEEHDPEEHDHHIFFWADTLKKRMDQVFSPKDHYDLHEFLVLKMSEIYRNKNSDYGDSFYKSYAEHGAIAAIVRMEDKMSRIKALLNSGKQNVKDESVEDTLIDLANYAIMTVISRRRLKGDI